MKCQNCNNNEANFFKQTNINGHIEELHLCAECAGALGHAGALPFAGAPFGGLGLFETLMSDFNPLFAQPRVAPRTAPATAIAHALAEVAPSVPFVADAELSRRRELNVLREQMRVAAESENFERAMELREQIKQLEVTSNE